MTQTTRAGTVFSAARLRSLALAGAVLPLALILSGCSAPEQAGVILSTSKAGYSAVVSTEAATGNSATAELTGSLVLGPGGCFEVLDATGTSNWLVLPAGSTVLDGDVPSLRIGNTTYDVGDSVDLGGGFAPLNEAALKVAGACSLEREPFTVHSTAP
ncbi:hypothetical protein [Paeniglutamicibacter sp. NPDC091659]|uniref:hypothetical protein n=1 Tax=Paeniglutamicibacter sp. NPDC091659 TaxID=3364389 RepID=UPI0037FD111C